MRTDDVEVMDIGEDNPFSVADAEEVWEEEGQGMV